MARLDLTIAENAIKLVEKRKQLTKETTYKRIPVTHVSFESGEGVQHTDENWNEGEPYAIVNFNAFNKYYLDVALEHLANEEYEEACAKTLSCRATIEDGVALQAAGFANVTTANRKFTPEGTDDEITTLAVYKATPSEMEEAASGGIQARLDAILAARVGAPVDANEPPA